MTDGDTRMDSLSHFSRLVTDVKTPADLNKAIEELGPLPRYAIIETFGDDIHDEKPAIEQAQAVYERLGGVTSLIS